MEFGIQIYGGMDLYRRQPRAFLAKLAEMGYAFIEPCVAFDGANGPDENLDEHFWSLNELDANLAVMRELGLSCRSFHAFGDLLPNLGLIRQTLERHQIRHMVINGPGGDLAAQFPAFVKSSKALAQGLKAAGADLWVHNGGAEIATRIGGQTFLEAVAEQCEGEVGLQLDVGWVLAGGQDPAAYMDRVAPCLKSLHYKDMKKGFEALPPDSIQTCLGQGALDVPAICARAVRMGLPQLVDQDYGEGDLMGDFERSLRLLNTLAATA